MDSHASPTPVLSGLRHVEIEPGHHAFGTLENVAIQVWLDRARDQDAKFMMDIGAQLTGAYPGGFSNLHVVRAGTRMPTAGARAAFATMAREYGALLGEVLVVLDGSGFWVSAMHGLMTGVRLAAGGAVGFRSFENVEDAVQWLPAPHRQRTGVTISGSQVLAAIQHLSHQCQ